MQKLIESSRQALQLTLEFVPGYGPQDLPADLYRHLFINSASGSVNSGGLPYPQYNSEADRLLGHENPEYGSPILNGDAVMIRLDFDRAAEGQVGYSSRLIETPCLVADEALKNGSPLLENPDYHKFAFSMSGIGRLSMVLGARNQPNAAIVGVKYPGDSRPRLLATSDAGRPYEFDPTTLETLRPVGWLDDWAPTMPPSMRQPLPTMLSTAHPVFDPSTREFFMVNFVKSLKTLTGNMHFAKTVADYPEYAHKALEEYRRETRKARSYEERAQLLENLYFTLEERIYKHKAWHEKLKEWFDRFLKGGSRLAKWLHKTFDSHDCVYLLRWDGRAGKMRRWRVLDEEGKDIRILQIMHQIGITEDYLVLMDSSFKFTTDQMFVFPFGKFAMKLREIDAMLRDHATITQEPFTNVYLVRRADLAGDQETVTAKKVVLEQSCLHFHADYANPGGRVTLYTANNSANCAAEWVRPYDTLAAPDPSEPPRPLDPDWISFFAIGNMDVCTIGKYVIHAPTCQLDKERTRLRTETGNLADPQRPGPHTWGIALCTYRDVISPEHNVDQVRNIYWQNMGLFPETLTRFIYDLYRDYSPNRIVPAEEVARLTWERMPAALVRTETEGMEFADHYIFPQTSYMRAIQFVNRKRSGPLPEGLDLSTDGYIVLAMVVQTEDSSEKPYQAQFWIFDAADLQRGPLCKLFHPDIRFTYPLHSLWLPEIHPPEPAAEISVRQDYDRAIQQNIPDSKQAKRAHVRAFFERHVYPHFERS